MGSMTSLAVACYQGHMKVVKRLLTNVTVQCDVNMANGKSCNMALQEVIDYTQRSPLYKLCIRGDTVAVVDVVHVSDFNMQDRDERLRCITLA
jgi:hypothetical protein